MSSTTATLQWAFLVVVARTGVGCGGSGDSSDPAPREPMTSVPLPSTAGPEPTDFPGLDAAEIKATAAAADGTRFVTGTFAGTRVAEALATPSTDVFVARVDGGGRMIWQQVFGGRAHDDVSALALGENVLLLTGYFGGSVDFDPGPGQALGLKVGRYSDAYVTSFDRDGQHLWTATFASANEDDACYGTSVQILADGRVLATGVFRGLVDFDPGQATALRTSSGRELNRYEVRLGAAGEFQSAHTDAAPPP